jgi:hypothetical protein
MVLQIEIAPQTEQRLRERAQAAGKDVTAYVSQLVEQAAAKPNIDEILAPLRESFEASGVSDAELIADITAAQGEHRSTKSPFSGSPEGTRSECQSASLRD